MSCDSPGSRNIEVSGGTLKLKVKNEEYLGKKVTGATISTKDCFKSGRIEIRAKAAIGDLLYSNLFMLAHQDGCNNGMRKGEVDIATIKGFENIWPSRAKLY